MSKRMQGNIMLFITALIWGTAFVAQSTGMNHVGPFTYNGVRNLIASLVLIPIIAVFDRMRQNGSVMPAEAAETEDTAETGSPKTAEKADPAGTPKAGTASALMWKESFADMKSRSYRYGAVCGIFLFIASSLQQCGISMTTAGKAGFITALYIIIVPVLGIFLKKKITPVIWLCVVIAIIGFYLLCIKEGFSISTGDLLVLCCAFFFSLHILVIDHFNRGTVDGVRMSQAQFLTVAILSVPFILLQEMPPMEISYSAPHLLQTNVWAALFQNIWSARLPILYAAVMSSGVAYTLQILGQRYTDPTTATLLMSLESVFAALSGWLILHEHLSIRELAGCALVFAAVLMAQLAPDQSASRS